MIGCTGIGKEIGTGDVTSIGDSEKPLKNHDVHDAHEPCDESDDSSSSVFVESEVNDDGDEGDNCNGVDIGDNDDD